MSATQIKMERETMYKWKKAYEEEAQDHIATSLNLQKLIKELEEKLNKVFKDARQEMDYRDKKITFLEAECERLYQPIREFWDIEKDEEVKKWEAAVEYKQKEIDQLGEQSKWLVAHIDWDNLTREESGKAIVLFRKYFPHNF